VRQPDGVRPLDDSLNGVRQWTRVDVSADDGTRDRRAARLRSSRFPHEAEIGGSGMRDTRLHSVG
jgi:hypothetical protein